MQQAETQKSVEELACMTIANSTLLKRTKQKGKSENGFNFEIL